METNFAEMTVAVLASYELSEADLAKRLGVSQPTIHRIKSGAVKSPNYHLGAKIHELYESRPKSGKKPQIPKNDAKRVENLVVNS